MSKKTPTLYRLTNIDDVEGLEDGRYRLVGEYGESTTKYNFRKGKFLSKWVYSEFTHYLRPLPPGMVAVSPTNLEDFIEWLNDNYEREHKKGWSNLWIKNEDGLEYTTKEVVAQFIITKLAQMGE